MARGFKFELVAASYMTQGTMVRKPFSITLPEGNPRINQFRGNHAFKETPVTLPDPVPATKPDPASDAGGKGGSGTGDEKPTGPLARLSDHVPRNYIDLLRSDGFTTENEIVDAGAEKLLEIKGVGEKMAARIVEAAKEILAEEE